MITYCPSCGIANGLTAKSCQACRNRLSEPTEPKLSVQKSSIITVEAEPFYILAERARLARLAFRALMSAALMSLSRAVLMPFLITLSPRGTFGRIDAATLQQTGYYAAVGFCIAAIWARRDPLFPTIAALCIYLGLAIPGALDGTTLISRGIISKSIMVLLLLRALNAAIQYRTTRHRPSLASIPS